MLALTREYDDPLAVSVRVALAEPTVITSPFHGGVVSASYVSADDEIAHGDRVLQIDGIDRLAIKSSVPFWRDLSLGATGEDVAALQAFLLKKGVLDLDGEEPEGKYGPATATAVRQLSLDLGYSSSTPDTRSDLVTLPASAVITGVSGTTCVLVGESPDRIVDRTVEVVSSSGNQAELATGTIRESEPVVVNPRVALPGVGCS